MKTLIQSVIAMVAVGAACSKIDAAVITNFAIGLSPIYSTSASTEIEHNVKKFILDAPKGSRIRLDDAFSLKTITAFSVPNLNYDSPANRARLLAPVFAKVTQWFAEARASGESSTITNSALLRVPEYLDFIAGNGGGQPRGILLIGSPFAQYPTEPTFSMTGSDEGPCVPSDGNLLAGLQSTPYGTAERKGGLRGSQISWCYGSENVWSNGFHKTLVTRFWTLFCKQLDGAFVAFTPDMASAFVAVSKPRLPAVANFDLNLEDTKIEMRLARPRVVPTWLPQGETNAASATSVSAVAVVERTAATTQQRANAQNPAGPSPRSDQRNQAQSRPLAFDTSQPIASTVDIGIMWESRDSQLDLDLYVRPRPGAEELWYQKVRTPEGAYIRDWTQPNNTTDFEWVKLNPGARLGEVEAWVNLFKGRGPISGRVAVHFGNRTFTGSFNIPAMSGNGGIDARTRQTSTYWTRLNLQQILSQNQ